MRGDPDYIDASCRERDRVARGKFASERESYRAEAEQAADDKNEIELSEGDDLTENERLAFQAGLKIGKRQERRRIIAGLDALLRETAALWFEGTAPTKAVAAYTAAVRKIVEGEGK